MAKGKKKAPARKAKAAPAAAPAAILEKPVHAAKAAAAELLQARHGEMVRLLADTSDLIRAATLAEVDIGRQKEMAVELEQSRKSIVAELAALKKENGMRKKEVDALTKDRNQVASQNAALEKKQTSLTREVGKLDEKHDKMRKDVDHLEKQALRLKEDVDRLEGIRREYTERISRFRQMREDLIR